MAATEGGSIPKADLATAVDEIERDMKLWADESMEQISRTLGGEMPLDLSALQRHKDAAAEFADLLRERFGLQIKQTNNGGEKPPDEESPTESPPAEELDTDGLDFGGRAAYRLSREIDREICRQRGMGTGVYFGGVIDDRMRTFARRLAGEFVQGLHEDHRDGAEALLNMCARVFEPPHHYDSSKVLMLELESRGVARRVYVRFPPPGTVAGVTARVVMPDGSVRDAGAGFMTDVGADVDDTMRRFALWMLGVEDKLFPKMAGPTK